MAREGRGLACYLLRLQTEGQARALVEGQWHLIEPGDLLLYGPNDPYGLEINPHESESGIASVDYFVFCQGEWLDQWWNLQNRPSCAHIPLDEDLLTVWRQLVREHQFGGNSHGEVSDYLLRVLCLLLDRTLAECGVMSGLTNSWVVLRMKRFLERHAAEELSLRDVADHVGLSVSRAVHVFKASTGTTLFQYLLTVRLRMAQDRIRFSGLTLEQVAESTGFRSYSYFYRAFRDHFGLSPKQFRDGTERG